MLSGVQLFATPPTVARQAPLFTEFSRQEHWSGLRFHPPKDLPDLGIEAGPLVSCAWQVSSLSMIRLGSLSGCFLQDRV